MCESNESSAVIAYKNVYVSFSVLMCGSNESAAVRASVQKRVSGLARYGDIFNHLFFYKISFKSNQDKKHK